MKSSVCKQLPLCVAIGMVLVSQATWANSDEVLALGTLTATTDRQGTKIKTNVITATEKDESTATDLRELLRTEPAMDFGGGSGTSQFWSIRGMGQNSVDLKLDNAYTDSQILYHQGRHMLDPSLVKIISIQKGAGSASAGIGATNGAIVAKTVDAADLLKGQDKDWGVKVGAGYSSNNGHNYGVSGFGRMGNFDFLLAGNRTNDGDYKAGSGYQSPRAANAIVPFSGLDKQSWLAKVGGKFGDHHVSLSHSNQVHKGVRTVREEFTEFEAGNDRQAPAYRETTQQLSNLEWNANNLGMIEKANANAYRLMNKRYSADDTGCGYCGNIAGATTTVIDTKGANLNLDWTVGEGVLKTGLNYRHQTVIPHAFLVSNVRLSNPEKTDIGVYAESINDIGPVTLTAGMRYDTFRYKAMDGKEASSGAFSPSVGAIWQATPDLSISASHNYASRSPRMFDALMTHGKRGIISVADNVKAETAKNTELGFNYSHQFGSGRLTANGSYFWQHINNALAAPQNRHGFKGVREVVNAGYIKNQGYELGLGYQTGALRANLGVAYSEPRIYDTNPNNLLSANPEFAVQVGRTWTGSVAYRFNQPNVEVGIKHRQVESVSNANAVLARLTETYRRDGYGVTDVFANWKPYGNDKMNVNFAINNVADRYYRPHSQRTRITSLPAAGREFKVGVNYTF